MAPSSKKSKKSPEPVPEMETDDADNKDIEMEMEEEEETMEVENGQTKEERSKNARKRRRAVARRKGYRHLATKAGYSTIIASADASRDVTQNVLTVKETIRACKWSPAMPDCSAFDSLEEYSQRLKLAQEPLSAGPAAVFRASGEIFLRKIINESVQRTFENGKTRVSVNTVMSVLRPLQSVLSNSFVAPLGLVRHAQITPIGGEGKKTPALSSLDTDEAQMAKEKKYVLPKQMEIFKATTKAMAEAKKSKVSSKTVNKASVGKKKRKCDESSILV